MHPASSEKKNEWQQSRTKKAKQKSKFKQTELERFSTAIDQNNKTTNKISTKHLHGHDCLHLNDNLTKQKRSLN